MKNKIILSIAFLSVLIACNQAESKLLGTWEIQKVKSEFGLFNALLDVGISLNGGLSGIHLELNRNNLMYIEDDEGKRTEGYWNYNSTDEQLILVPDVSDTLRFQVTSLERDEIQLKIGDEDQFTLKFNMTRQ